LHVVPEPIVSGHEGIWITDAAFQTTFVNGRVTAMAGYRNDAIVGRPMTDFVEPADREAVQKMLDRLPEGIADQREIRLLSRDGTPLFVVLELRALFTSDGEFKGVRASVIDITPRRLAEERLRRREAQLVQAHSIARLGSWEWDLATGLVTSSDEAFRLFGVEPRAPRPFDEAFRSIDVEYADETLEKLRTAATQDEPVDYYFMVRAPDGSRREMHARAQRVRDLGGEGMRVVGVVQDVTERRLLEERLQQAERVSSLGRLAASVAHEFNNILMGIQPFAEVILRNTTGDLRVYEAGARIADAVARGKRVTQEILRYTRTPEPARIPVDVAEWLSAAYAELVELAGNEISLTMEVEGGMRMVADPQQLRQVFSNFITNARDAMPQGGTITVRARRRIGRRANDTALFVHFAVADSGSGMSPETIRMAFEPLFTTKHIGGTGLGLAIADQIVRRHNGEMWVESVLGLGSTFHVLIPAAAAGERAHIPAEVLQPAGAPLERLLLVEDDPAVAAGLIALLEMDGITIELVERGADAVSRIEAFAPDAVVLDVGLPDISGIAVYDQIARRWPSLPVLFSTGHGDERLLPPPSPAPTSAICSSRTTATRCCGSWRSCGSAERLFAYSPVAYSPVAYSLIAYSLIRWSLIRLFAGRLFAYSLVAYSLIRVLAYSLVVERRVRSSPAHGDRSDQRISDQRISE
jgi:PAS domain S-box-containing protein